MEHRVRILSLTSVICMIQIGCSSGAPPQRSTLSSAPTERAIQLPGKYVAPEIDRGAQPHITPSLSTQDLLAGLPMGRVLFACPSSMRVQAPERVEVRITGNPKEDISAGLQQRGVAAEEATKISPVMKVTLTPEEGGVFDVKSLSEEQQLTSGGDFAQWVWSVTPLKSGTHALYLTVNVVVDVPGLGAQKRQIPVLTQEVRVRADIAYSSGQFWSSNWQWFTTTLLIPVGLWLWKKRRPSKT